MAPESSQVYTMSSNQLTQMRSDKDMSKSKRNLRSPRLNGDSILETTLKLKEMEVTKAQPIQRANSLQRVFDPRRYSLGANYRQESAEGIIPAEVYQLSSIRNQFCQTY